MRITCITSSPHIEAVRPSLEQLGKLKVFDRQQLSADEVVELAEDTEVLIAGTSGIGRIDAELIDRLPQLKLIALLTVGFDWVDVNDAREKGVVVCNIKGANSESVSEQTWGMILDLAKRITEFNQDAMHEGAFEFGRYKGKEVFGKTLGVIGLGDIGKKVARGASGFGMKVIGVNQSGKPVEGVILVSLTELLQNADVIAIATPLNDETRGLIGTQEIELMKTGVIVVNCAREEIVDKTAIIAAVKTGKVFGYGVETAIMKQIPPSDPYFTTKRIIAVPHNAFNTEDADKKSYELVVENIQRFIEGQPQNVVN